MEEAQFIKGFNNGYFLKEHEPALIAKIMKGISGENSYLEGLKEGVKQRENELNRDRIRKSIEKGNNGKIQDRDRKK